MSQSASNNGIHCNSCDYEGAAKTNSSTMFLIFFVLLCSSVFFLPLIVISLIFMGIIVAKPAKKSCPACKSADVRDLSDEEAGISSKILTENRSKTDDNA
ncbi:MAG: hypothetical protein OEM38_05445 [Gammaproteobacteria bacterium]|nr:hypothetical protein [Gammaproteobacteria bacterium]